MRHRHLRRTGLKVSRLALGTLNLAAASGSTY
jgi:aryl-alcohol dehydrogenase-like predicted oxidoreductase